MAETRTLDPIGQRKTHGAYVSIVAAATSTTLYQLTTGRVRTARIRKIAVYNGQAAPILLTIGETVAAAFVQRLPALYCVNGQDSEWTEEQIPGLIFTSDIIGRASAAAVAPADVQVLLEVEEVE